MAELSSAVVLSKASVFVFFSVGKIKKIKDIKK